MSAPRQIVAIGDTHSGCQFSVVPIEGVSLDGGGRYAPSSIQKRLWGWWRDFWDVWVPEVTQGEPYILVHLGDALDGNHHEATTQISHNLGDQANIAYDVLKPIVARAHSYYHIRGTEAHVGPSAAEEERLAARLGAVPDDQGNHARWEMWMRFHSKLIHWTHHVGATGSVAYEGAALNREMANAFSEAGVSGRRPPDLIVRGHRHREFAVSKGAFSVITLPPWQTRTPYSYRLPMGRFGQPEIGGTLIRLADDGQRLYTWPKVYYLDRPKEVVIG